MIKNVVVVALSALILYLTFFIYQNGIDLTGKLPFIEEADVLSFQDILSQGDVLKSKIAKIESLNSSDIVTAKKEVENEKNHLRAYTVNACAFPDSVQADALRK